MSRMLDIADAIKTRLESRAALEEIPVVVDRQKDIAVLIAKSVGRSKGSCITILWDGFGVPDPNTSGPQVTSRYTLRTWSRPVINNETPADELVEEICKALHHWIPVGVHAFGEMTVSGGDFVPDSKWLIYEVDVEVTLKL
jgi:hypothetical protein